MSDPITLYMACRIKIISGGQTGVDRAALDFAIENNLDHGGYCPKGRKAEDGKIPDTYNLTETSSSDYRVRTEKNLTESDGTLIINYGQLTGGTKLTYNLCRKKSIPVYVADTRVKEDILRLQFKDWLKENNIEVLNVAGPREKKISSKFDPMEALYCLFS